MDIACPSRDPRPARPGPPVPGHMADLGPHITGHVVSPRPGTRDKPSLPILGHVAVIACPSRDPWLARLARPGTCGGHRLPLPGHVADIARPVPGHVAEIARLSWDPGRVRPICPGTRSGPSLPVNGIRGVLSPPIPGPAAGPAGDMWRTLPARTWTRSPLSPYPRWPWPTRPGTCGVPSPESRDQRRAQPARPGTRGIHCPPVPGTATPGHVADIVRLSWDLTTKFLHLICLRKASTVFIAPFLEDEQRLLQFPVVLL
ncbi:basic proline-rich protein-like [Macrobrachium nipponense]|uniref:basic proline-rich protein-like n=1 Tax=Macrobrachium nipponense TaxID=159736 RepID=UPI0030C82333